MTARLLLKLFFFGFIAASVLSVLHKAASSRAAAVKARASAAAAQPAPAKAAPAAAQKMAVVYYFYTDVRCASCAKLEAYTREAVQSRLGAGYRGWRVEFRGVNVDEPANAHFKQDYRLDSKAVIVQKFDGGKPADWAKLDRIWTLLGDKPAFLDYVAAETRRALDRK